MDILKSSQLVIFSHSTIFIFLQKSCRFSLQTLTKFEAAKTGSGVGFLRLTAVWSRAFLKLTADQVLVFDWIAGSGQVNLLKTGQDCSEAA